MLCRLYIKNIALIKEADIEFDSGLNVLSGETGSGKSVILDSVNFVLGSKADKSMIRFGENEAIVKAEFNVDSACEAITKLTELDIESDGTIIISRKLTVDGKNTIKINGNTVTVAMLKNISQHLVDVHGQSEHLFLLREDNQLKVIDELLGEKAITLKEAIKDLITEKKQYEEQINALGGDEAERERKLDLLKYQINEIERADIKIGEFEELKIRQSKLINLEKILSAMNTAKSYIDNDGGISDGIFAATRELHHISSIDEEYEKIAERLENVNSEMSDISQGLSDLIDDLSFDGNEVEAVEERLATLKSIFKKYGGDAEAAIKYKEKIEKEYDEILNSAVIIEECNKKLSVCEDKIYDLYLKLSKIRKQVAENFAKNVEEQLKSLNIPDAKFNINFADFKRDSVKFTSANVADQIMFEFSANKGEPLKPLNKVISGGEMSRFMLAIKTQLKSINGISTYIFDEIDAGISGYTAGMVAKKFISIAKNTQILAVSHLPQVCAASDTQYLIYKVEEDNKTYTKVKRLSYSEKLYEIVRLTGSIKSTSAIKHAEELIQQYKN